MRFALKAMEWEIKIVEFLVGEQGQAIRKSVGIVGGMVIGAVAATWVPIKLPSSWSIRVRKSLTLVLQDKLDGVYPGLLTAVFIVFAGGSWPRKRPFSNQVMLILVVIAFLGVLAGFFNPGLNIKKKRENHDRTELIQGYETEIQYQKHMVKSRTV